MSPPSTYSELIRDDHIHIAADIFLDVLRKRTALGILSMEETQIAPALPNANDNFLGFFASMYTPPDFLSADIGFVHFKVPSNFASGGSWAIACRILWQRYHAVR